MEIAHRDLLDKALNTLYTLEDRTEYKNKNISEAVNLLQKELRSNCTHIYKLSTKTRKRICRKCGHTLTN